MIFLFKKIVFTAVCAFSIVILSYNSAFCAEDGITFSGVTESIKDLTLSLPVPGRIAKISLKEGDKVKVGDVILNLDKNSEELAVKLRLLLWKNRAEVDSAAARVATLASFFKSSKQLFETTKSVSREELEKRELEYKLAIAEHERLKMVEDKEKIEYELTSEELNKRLLRSPINGTIIKIFMDIGESTQEHKPLVHVSDTSRCLFTCNVEEKIGRNLKKGDEVTLQVQTGSQLINKKGIIIFASPVADPASGLLVVKAEFDNSDGQVRPGVSGFLVYKKQQKKL